MFDMPPPPPDVLSSRIEAMIVGQFVADAATLGAHWIYDQDEILARYGEIEGFEAPVEGHYHYPKKPGDFTHLADSGLVVLRSVAEQGRFEAQDFGERWFATINPDHGYTGYVDGATRETLATAREERDPNAPDSFGWQSGADDDETVSSANVAPVVAAHLRASRSEFLAKIDEFVHVRQVNARARAWNRAFAAFLVALLHGAEYGQAADVMSEAVEDVTLKEEIEAAVARVRAGVSMSVNEATIEYGQACPLDGAVPSALHVLFVHGDDFRAAVLATIRAGGDSAGRAAMIGAAIGARHGIEAIPAEWIQRLSARDEVVSGAKKLAGSL